ncbi:PilW family protein [Vibrio paucivorans]
MAIQSAISRSSGASLIEFMVASLVGVIAIGLVGSVFMSGQKAALERSKHILLLQNMNAAMQQLKEDMQRAGYNGSESGVVMLSGASQVVHTQSSPGTVGYVYRVMTSGAEDLRHVVYRHQPESSGADLLRLCEKHQSDVLTPASAADSGYAGVCFSIFDPNQINVDGFSVENSLVASDSASSAFTTISMSASLIGDSSVSHSMVLNVQQRNWQ